MRQGVSTVPTARLATFDTIGDMNESAASPRTQFNIFPGSVRRQSIRVCSQRRPCREGGFQMTTEDPSPGPVSEAESTAKPNPLVASDHGLTEEQQEAMKLGRHLAVTAAAGTGKTTALAARYLHILQQTDSTPTEIATITFTRKATTEMRDRIRENVSEQLQSIEDGDSFDRWRGSPTSSRKAIFIR